RLLADFSGEEALAKLSRERLTALGGAPPAPGAASPSLSDEEANELVRLQDLVKNSPDLLNPGDGVSAPPVMEATRRGWLTAVTFLVDHGARITPNALAVAAQEGHKSIV